MERKVFMDPKFKVFDELLPVEDVHHSSESQCDIISSGEGSVSCMETCVAINTLGEGLLRLDSDKNIIFANNRALDLLGYSLEEIRGVSFLSLLVDSTDNKHQNGAVNFLTPKSNAKTSITLETNLKSKDETLVPILLTINAVNRVNQSLEYLALIDDIKSLKMIYDQSKDLLQAEKISVLGHLASSIAHEVNNPLSYMIMDVNRQLDLYNDLDLYLNSLNGKIPLETLNSINTILKDLKDIAETTDHGLHRIADIVRAVKTYSRMEEGKKIDDISLEETLEVAIKLVSSDIKNKIQLKREYAPNLPRLKTNGGRLAQVALNMLVNSIQAIDGNGIITIRTFLNRNDGIGFEIEDNGRGIAPEVMNRLFEPYFTTKIDGTGLGLSIAKNIISEMGGSIKCQSSLNVGTKMIVVLPLPDKETSNRLAITTSTTATTKIINPFFPTS